MGLFVVVCRASRTTNRRSNNIFLRCVSRRVAHSASTHSRKEETCPPPPPPPLLFLHKKKQLMDGLSRRRFLFFCACLLAATTTTMNGRHWKAPFWFILRLVNDNYKVDALTSTIFLLLLLLERALSLSAPLLLVTRPSRPPLFICYSSHREQRSLSLSLFLF